MSEETVSESTYDEAEARAEQTIRDLQGGLISKRGVTNVKNAAEKVLRGYDLHRGIKNVP